MKTPVKKWDRAVEEIAQSANCNKWLAGRILIWALGTLDLDVEVV